jgi:hypothetical protein
MTDHDPHGIKDRIREELRKYLIVSAYLFVCFGALQLYKTALLNEEGIRYLPMGLAATKALILGKFLLIGESARVGTRLRLPTLLHRIAFRTFTMAVLLIVLSVIEELIVGAVHGRSVAQTFAEHGGHTIPELGATCLLGVLILVPLVVMEEVDDALGRGTLRRLLLAPPGSGTPAGGAGGDHVGTGGPR